MYIDRLSIAILIFFLFSKNFPFNFSLDRHASERVTSHNRTNDGIVVRYPLFIGFLSFFLLFFSLPSFFSPPSSSSWSCPLFMNIPAAITKRPLSFAGEYSCNAVASFDSNERTRLERISPVANVKRDESDKICPKRCPMQSARGWDVVKRVNTRFIRIANLCEVVHRSNFEESIDFQSCGLEFNSLRSFRLVDD